MDLPDTTRRVVLFTEDDPLVLSDGSTLAPVEVAYETDGTLDEDGGNAVFVCHALTGDAHAAGPDGWWESMVGPGRPVDTERFFVVSANLLGGCRGTTGPSSTDPRTGRSYGLSFPVLSMSDLVTVHRRLLRHLGVARLHTAIGGSLGGMQVLQWALDAPGEIERAVLVAASGRLTAQNIAFSAVARDAIMRDPDFAGGAYLETDYRPDHGLAMARRMAHITYVSEESMEAKFGRRRVDEGPPRMGTDFQVESYLDHQASIFLARFDALSYLYLSRVMDYFDPFADPSAGARIAAGGTRFLVLSFDTDWRFPTSHSERVRDELMASGVRVRSAEIASPWGHDSFLLDPPGYLEAVHAFLHDDSSAA